MDVVLDESIHATVTKLLELLRLSEFTTDLEALLRDTYKIGRRYGEAFARMMTALTSKHGLILLDPQDKRLKSLAAPLYSKAASQANEIANAIVIRSKELEAAGYHAQVTPSENSFPLFLHDETGARHAVTRNQNGKYTAKNSEQEYTAAELAKLALEHPERFSPNVTLRAVV